MVTEGAWCWLWKVFSNSGSRLFSSEVKNHFLDSTPKQTSSTRERRPTRGRQNSGEVQNNCLPTIMSDVKHRLVR